MSKKTKFKKVDSAINFIDIEHEMLKFWDESDIFNKLRKKNKGNQKWSFLDGPITANNPMGVHHAWGRTLKDLYQRYHSMLGKELRYQNGFDCQGLWVEVEVEKELGFKSKRDIEDHGIENFVNLCKDRVRKFSKIQTNQSKRLGYWMDWNNSYFTMSDENNYAIWAFLKKLFDDGKIYKGSDVVPWSGRSGTSYSQMEIIEGRKLVSHLSVFVKFPLKKRKNESLLIWTTTPWTLTSNISAAVNVNLDYLMVKSNDGHIYYIAEENFKFERLEKQFKDKKQWIKGVPKLKTLEQIFKERGGYTIKGKIKGEDLIGMEYLGPFDELPAQQQFGGFPFVNEDLKNKEINAIKCHKVIDGGKDSIGNDNVVAGEGTGIVHIATGCGAIDNKIGKKNNLVSIAPLNDESKYLDEFGWLNGLVATDKSTTDKIICDLKEKKLLFYSEQYPHVYPHCWRSGDELVFRTVDEWYINMDWRDKIHKIVDNINWIPDWGNEKEHEWLNNMGDWMISKKRFWGLALPIWTFDDNSFYVVGSKQELKKLAVEGWDDFEGNSPHRPWIDKVKIKHPDTGLVGKRIPDVGNPWLDAGIVPFSTLKYNHDKEYWKQWYPADFVTECFPGQFRNWFYSLLAMSTIMDNSAPFKTLLGHALVKDETGRDMHKSWGNAIWFEDAAEKMGVDVMRWLYASQNPEQNLRFGYGAADEVRKRLITLWNTYSFFVTYARLDNFDPNSYSNIKELDLTKLDHWILAKINELIKISRSYYDNYQIFKMIDEVVKFIDNLSNWYVRRNRRRFWKSENDSDKIAAYATLYETLMVLLKIIAPVTPFLTDKIYKNLALDSKIENNESIHLTDFPAYNNEWANKDLINEIDTVISIVTMGRSCRNLANIKNRQPLNELIIYSNEKIEKLINNNSNQILEELNIKKIKFIENVNEIINYKIKPNFSMLSKKFGKNMKEVINLIENYDTKKLFDKVKYKKDISIDLNGEKYIINPEEIIIQEVPVNNYSVVSNKKYTIGINTLLSDSLIKEGIVRDVIRHIQSLRKEINLNVEDRIDIKIDGSKQILEALTINKEYFFNEVLAVSFNQKPINMNEAKTIKINGKNINVCVIKNCED